MNKQADICLLLEGTYPYIRGGVSSWVHQIICGLPEMTFHIVFLGGDPALYDMPAYELPENVIGFEKHYLLSDDKLNKPKARDGRHKPFELWRQLMNLFSDRNTPVPDSLLTKLTATLGVENQLSLEDFLYSRESWHILTECYEENAANQSFVDYFWTYRNIYRPLFVLAGIARNLPNARAYHSVSTGYAGFLGALCAQKTGRPFLLTEHGIYTKERKIDLAQAAWIQDRHNAIDISMHKQMDTTRQTWIRFFEQLGLTAYHHASDIVALFEGNRLRQVDDGAPTERTKVIVNGIKLPRFDEALKNRPFTPPPVVGLVGRVVPIKDIKTFIRTIRGALEIIPNLEGWIVGPTEEDPDYVHECKLLIESLGLQNNIKMLGMQNVVEILPKLGAMVLTSISEAQPLVLLEAMASGIPCIATEVGACREIIDGMPGDDAKLGSAGLVVPIANPAATADAIVNLLNDEQRWHEMGDIGRQRVERYYDEEMMYNSYRQLYQKAISWQE